MRQSFGTNESISRNHPNVLLYLRRDLLTPPLTLAEVSLPLREQPQSKLICPLSTVITNQEHFYIWLHSNIHRQMTITQQQPQIKKLIQSQLHPQNDAKSAEDNTTKMTGSLNTTTAQPRMPLIMEVPLPAVI